MMAPPSAAGERPRRRGRASRSRSIRTTIACRDPSMLAAAIGARAGPAGECNECASEGITRTGTRHDPIITGDLAFDRQPSHDEPSNRICGKEDLRKAREGIRPHVATAQMRDFVNEDRLHRVVVQPIHKRCGDENSRPRESRCQRNVDSIGEKDGIRMGVGPESRRPTNQREFPKIARQDDSAPARSERPDQCCGESGDWRYRDSRPDGSGDSCIAGRIDRDNERKMGRRRVHRGYTARRPDGRGDRRVGAAGYNCGRKRRVVQTDGNGGNRNDDQREKCPKPNGVARRCADLRKEAQCEPHDAYDRNALPDARKECRRNDQCRMRDRVVHRCAFGLRASKRRICSRSASLSGTSSSSESASAFGEL